MRIEEFQTRGENLQPGSPACQAQDAPGGLDCQGLIEQFSGHLDILERTTASFLRALPAALAELHLALQASDAQRLARLAHNLKGSVGVFETGSAYAALCHLEELAGRDEMGCGQDALDVAQREIARLQEDLIGLQRQVQKP